MNLNMDFSLLRSRQVITLLLYICKQEKLVYCFTLLKFAVLLSCVILFILILQSITITISVTLICLIADDGLRELTTGSRKPARSVLFS